MTVYSSTPTPGFPGWGYFCVYGEIPLRIKGQPRGKGVSTTWTLIPPGQKTRLKAAKCLLRGLENRKTVPPESKEDKIPHTHGKSIHKIDKK